MIILPGILLILYGVVAVVSIPVLLGIVVSVNLRIGTVTPPLGAI